ATQLLPKIAPDSTRPRELCSGLLPFERQTREPRMPTTKLTQAAVEKLKVPDRGRVEFWDSQLPGFGLRISDSGRKTWVALYRVGGKLVRETIGTGALIPNVAEARERARQSMQKAQAGQNPVKARREQAAMAAVERPPND